MSCEARVPSGRLCWKTRCEKSSAEYEGWTIRKRRAGFPSGWAASRQETSPSAPLGVRTPGARSKTCCERHGAMERASRTLLYVTAKAVTHKARSALRAGLCGGDKYRPFRFVQIVSHEVAEIREVARRSEAERAGPAMAGGGRPSVAEVGERPRHLRVGRHAFLDSSRRGAGGRRECRAEDRGATFKPANLNASH